MTFKNSNGKSYEILASKKDYTLLKEIDGKEQPYVVAYYIQERSWAKGRYYDSLEEATDSFIELTK